MLSAGQRDLFQLNASSTTEEQFKFKDALIFQSQGELNGELQMVILLMQDSYALFLSCYLAC
jgi:hypothetical protein